MSLKIKAVDIKKEDKISEDIDQELKRVELQQKTEHLERNKQDRTERKSYANKVFYLISVFICLTLLIVFLAGFKCGSFQLSDTVLTVLLSTTTVNVIGIFMVVMKYLFRDK
jgi:magnesium-transporting ATPase (P-type)